MNSADLTKLVDDTEHAILEGKRVGVIGATRTAVELLASLVRDGLESMVTGIYSIHPGAIDHIHQIKVEALESLGRHTPECLVIAADEEKEDLLRAALPHIKGFPKVIVSGYGHYRFRDPVFERILKQLTVPSLANGYPNSLIHLFQCLQNAAKLNLHGSIAELGMFQGGTTMFLSLATEALGGNWRILGFETFAGFPSRRSPLDMYDEPECVFTNAEAVYGYLRNRNVEIIEGDISRTCKALSAEDLVLSFVDTDNYSATRVALEIIRNRTVLHGAIVFDHFTGTDRFRYTLGERFAACSLLEDHRYFNLHGTGVFFRQQ